MITVFSVLTLLLGGAAAGASAAAAQVVDRVPDAPQTLFVEVMGQGDVFVAWAAPADQGSSPVLRYDITFGELSETYVVPAGGAACDGDPECRSGEVLFRQIDTGTYQVTVTATNAVGTSAPLTESVAVNSDAAPSAPRNVAAVQTGARQVTITFDPPSRSGSTPIVRYVVGLSGPESAGSQEYPASTRSVVLDDLTPGTYDIGVTAENEEFNGPRADTQVEVSASYVPPAAAPSPVPAAPTAAPAPAAPAGGQLPRTGDATDALALAGGGMVLLGVAFTAGARRRDEA